MNEKVAYALGELAAKEAALDPYKFLQAMSRRAASYPNKDQFADESVKALRDYVSKISMPEGISLTDDSIRNFARNEYEAANKLLSGPVTEVPQPYMEIMKNLLSSPQASIPNLARQHLKMTPKMVKKPLK